MVVLFLVQNIEITKFFFIKTALLKNKIIISFVKLVHKSFVSWNKKSSLEYTFKARLDKFWENQDVRYNRLHKLGIEAHAYAHYTSLLCFAKADISFIGSRSKVGLTID